MRVSKYQDEYTLWHDKANNISNNWQNYTAMAQKLGLPFDENKMRVYFQKCRTDDNYIIHRHPNKPTPPVSRDVIIGLFCLNLISYNWLKNNHFVYYGKGEPMNKKTLEKIMSGVLQLFLVKVFFKKYDRNTFWKRKVKNLYQAAFRLPPSDVYWLKKCVGKKPHREEAELWKLYVCYTLKKGTAGEKNLLWLQAKQMGDESLAKKCKPNVNFLKYFGADHDFYRRV